MVSPDALIGKKFGNYQLERPLGAGGMGCVYAAVHPTLGKRVAIKVLSEVNDRSAVGRLIDEARASTAIGSEHIVEVFDCGETPDGITYIAMELLVGDTLEEVLVRERRLQPRRAIAIARQICTALAAAHRCGIIHRDLKPQNVFLVRADDGTDRVKVLDFGLAKLLDAANRAAPATTTGTVVGTPFYMAPEQARGAPVDGRTDIFALGVILYRALSGTLPFAGETFTQVLASLLTDTPRPLAVAAPTAAVPPALDRLVLRALAREPAERPADMESFARALDACADELARDSGVRVDLDALGEAATLATAATFPEQTLPPSTRPAPAASRPRREARRTGESAVHTVEARASRRMFFLRLALYPTLVAIFLFGYFLLLYRGVGDRRLAREVIGVGVAALVVAYLLELGYYIARRRRRTPRTLHLALITAFILVATYALQLNGTLTNYMAMFYVVLIAFTRARLGGRAALFATGLAVSCFVGVALLEQAGVIGYARMLNEAAIPPLVRDRGYATVIIAGTVAFLLLAHIGAHILVRSLEAREEALADVTRGLEGQVQEKIAILHRRERLRHFLSPQLVDAVVSGANDARPGSRRQKLTIVACTLDDFFAQTAQLEPEEQVQLLNELYASVLDIARRFDAVAENLACASATLLCGVPGTQSDRDAAITGVRAAIALAHQLADRADAWKARGAGPISARVAVHTAYAAVGNFGTESRLVFGAVGPALALADLAAHAAPPGSVVVTQPTRMLCSDGIQLEPAGHLPAAGAGAAPAAGETIALFRVLDCT